MRSISLTTLFLVFITLLTFSARSQGNYGRISGVIITADSRPAEGVTILLRNTAKLAIADNKGYFLITEVPPGNYTISLSLVGHADIEKNITVAAGATTDFSVTLDLSALQLNEVVVTANKSSFKTNRLSSSLRLQRPIMELPQNVQVVTSRLIADQQIFDMLEGVTRNVSGATRIEHWDNYARITMRGSNVAAFRNGMNVSTSWGPLTEDMSMVERVEFVKGPAGFMMANGDPSGFYNVVTKKPSGRFKGEANLSVGGFNLYRAALDVDGKVTDNGKFLYRVNVMGQLKGSHRQFDFNNRYSLAPVLKFRPDDKTSITLEYTRQYAETNVIGSNYVFSNRGYADLPRNFTTSESNLAPVTMDDNSILGIVEHQFTPGWKVTGQLAYFNYKQTGASLWPWGFDAANDSLMQRGISIWDVLGKTSIGQVYVTGNFHTGVVGHKLLAGVDMSAKDYYHDWNQGAPLGGPVFNIYKPVYGQATAPVFDRSKSIRERGVRYYNEYSGIYLQDELAFLDDRLRVTIAGRYTSLSTGDVYSGDYKKSKVTPRIGLSYSINRNMAVYVLRDESFLENYGSDWQGKSFDPISGQNIEAGIKKDWFDGKWNASATAYQITRKNVLTADLDHPNPAGGFYNRQSGEQQTRGVEVDVKGQVIRGLDVLVNYAFTEAKTTKDSKQENIGVQVAGSSRHIHNTWLNYRIDRGPVAGLGVSLGYQYHVKRSPWFVFDGSQNSLPDYFRLDGGVSYQKDQFQVNVVVNNILNKYLYSGAPYATYYYWQAEPGTNARLTIGYKF